MCVLVLLPLNYEVFVQVVEFSSRCWVICSPHSRFVIPTKDVYFLLEETSQIFSLLSPSFAISPQGRAHESLNKGSYFRNWGVAGLLFQPLENAGPSSTLWEECRRQLRVENFRAELNKCGLLNQHTRKMRRCFGKNKEYCALRALISCISTFRCWKCEVSSCLPQQVLRSSQIKPRKLSFLE